MVKMHAQFPFKNTTDISEEEWFFIIPQLRNPAVGDTCRHCRSSRQHKTEITTKDGLWNYEAYRCDLAPMSFAPVSAIRTGHRDELNCLNLEPTERASSRSRSSGGDALGTCPKISHMSQPANGLRTAPYPHQIIYCSTHQSNCKCLLYS